MQRYQENAILKRPDTYTSLRTARAQALQLTTIDDLESLRLHAVSLQLLLESLISDGSAQPSVIPLRMAMLHATYVFNAMDVHEAHMNALKCRRSISDAIGLLTSS